MLPKVVMYNSVSVDGAIKDFAVDLSLHYKVLGRLGIDALLAGSETAKSGIEIFMKTVPPEEPSDFAKPVIESNDGRAIWVIVDSRGIMNGLMHVHRRSSYARDIVVLVSNQTPRKYLDYLRERNYDIIITGSEHVNYRAALEELNNRYGVRTIAIDTGGILASILLEQELVDEVQLLIAPEIVGKTALNLFRSLNDSVKLKLQQVEKIEGYAFLVWKTSKNT